MILNEQNKELAMELLCAMTIEDLAKESGKDEMDVYREFRKSNTFDIIFDEDTGLWLNGPDYVIEELRRETKFVSKNV